MNDSIPITEHLLVSSANNRNKIDLCPFHFAITRNNIDIVTLLLSKGANPDAITRDWRTEKPPLKKGPSINKSAT